MNIQETKSQATKDMKTELANNKETIAKLEAENKELKASAYRSPQKLEGLRSKISAAFGKFASKNEMAAARAAADSGQSSGIKRTDERIQQEDQIDKIRGRSAPRTPPDDSYQPIGRRCRSPRPLEWVYRNDSAKVSRKGFKRC